MISGSDSICLTAIVVCTAAVCVCTISVAPVTTTVSRELPTSSVTRTDAGVAVTTCTSGSDNDLKPISETVTVYVPGLIAGMVNVPSAPVTAV